MKTIDIENGCKIFSWCPEIEESALDQMEILAQLPFVKYSCLMPDAHLGMDMPIGGVIACENVVIPNCVGSDIGCGMGAIKTSLKKSDIEDEDLRKRIFHSLSRGIPVGFHHNSQKRVNELGNGFTDVVDALIDKSGIEQYCDKHNPLGTLGRLFMNSSERWVVEITSARFSMMKRIMFGLCFTLVLGTLERELGITLMH